jgi:hypothetical protein
MKNCRIAEAVPAVVAEIEETAKRPRLPTSSPAREMIWARYGAIWS